ncbi:xenobiotic acyltransferase family protein [Rhizobium sp. RAF56]|uniref:xenobiotic acyltransferase family protein n=1 Tax=Rhizobium sp. RAF56 TaxID=3233062 RepID=UPI003F9546CA
MSVRHENSLKRDVSVYISMPLPEDNVPYSSIAKGAVIKSPELIEHPVSIAPSSEIHGGCKIGSFLFLNFRSVIYPNVTIGRFCSIARNCEVGVARHPTQYLSTHSFQYNSVLFPDFPGYSEKKYCTWRAHPETTIGSDVWLGAQVIVVAGAKIGHGAVVAANAVVTKDVPPYAVVGGTPAKLIRYRFSEDVIEGLLETKWWDLPYSEIKSLPFDDPTACVEILRGIRSKTAAQ